MGRGRGAKRGAAKALQEAYREVWSEALDLELKEEWEESEQRLKVWSRYERVGRMHAWSRAIIREGSKEGYVNVQVWTV